MNVVSPSGLILLVVGAAMCACVVLLRRRHTAAPEEAAALFLDTIRWRPVHAVVATCCLLAFLFVAVLPVRSVGTTEGATTLESGLPLTPPDDSVPPAEMAVTISADGMGTTLFAPFSVLMALDQQLPGVVLIGWSRSPSDPSALVADTANNQISIRGRYPALDLLFATGPGAGTVSIEAGDLSEVVELESSAAGLNLLRVGSGSTRARASSSFGWSTQSVRFAGPVERLESTSVGLLPVRATPILDENGAIVGARVGVVDAVRAVGRAAFNVALLAIVAAFVLGLCTMVASAFGSARHHAGLIGWLRHAIYGLAFSMLLIGAANYVLPARWAVLLLLPFGALGGFRLTRPPQAADVPESASIDDNTGVVISVAVVVAVNAVWFVLSGRWALGFLQTDVFDTFNVTQLFWHQSALDASIAFGDGFRLIDYTARASVWGTMLERPSDAIVVMRLLFAALIAASAASVAARQGYRAWTQVLMAVLTSGSAAFVGLYAEGYMSREFFVAWMLLGLLAVAHQLLDADRGLWPWWRVGTVCCVSLAIVPPYYLIGPALAAVLVAAVAGADWRTRLGSWKPAIMGLSAAIIGLGTPNLFWLRSSSDASQYIEALNGIVRNIGVPFYGTARFPAAMVGLLPFHHQDGHRLGGSDFAFGPLRWSTDWLGNSVVVGAFLFMLLACFVIALSVFRRLSQHWADRGIAALWVSIVIGYLGTISVLRLFLWDAQTYFTIMLIWTLAPVALMALAFTFLEAGRLDTRVRTVLLGAVVALTAVNVVSAAGESALWVESTSGPRATQWHYDQVAPIERFDRALARGDIALGDETFAVVIDQPSALTGTDDDRVLTNVLANLLEAEGYECPDCFRNPDFYWIAASSAAPETTPIVVIGSADCRQRRTLYVDEYFAVCAGADGTTD